MKSVDNDFYKYGASYLLSSDAHDRYNVGHDSIGRPDGQFVTPTNQMDDMLKEANGNTRYMEDRLGLPEGRLGENPIRIDIYHPEQYNLRVPEASMSGANEYFIPGAGKTSGGMSEGVINPIPNPQSNPEVGSISYAKNPQESIAGTTNNEIPVIFSGNTPSSGGGSRAPNIDSITPSNADLEKAKVNGTNLDGLLGSDVQNSALDKGTGLSSANRGIV